MSRHPAEEHRRLVGQATAAGALAAVAAHALNNPLTTIAMAVNMLAELDGDDRDRMLVVVEQEVRRATSIVNELGRFGHLDDLPSAPVDLPTVLREVAAAAVVVTPEAVVVDPATGPVPATTADPVHLHLCLADLVARALAAGPAVTVHLGVRADGDRSAVTVTDDGPGIEPAAGRALFDPFANAARFGHAVGLAAASARLHADLLGAALGAERLPDGRNCHVLSLPAAAVPARPPTPSNASRRTSMTGRILVVDDESSIRGLLQALLERAGWQVQTAGDRASAADAVTTGEFDVVLLDLRLDGEDGEQVLAELEQMRPGIAERTAFITGAPPSGGRIAGRPVLGKPFTWRDLEALLTRLHPDDSTA